MCTTEEEYENIILSVNVKKVEIMESAKNLSKQLKMLKFTPAKTCATRCTQMDISKTMMPLVTTILG